MRLKKRYFHFLDFLASIRFWAQKCGQRAKSWALISGLIWLSAKVSWAQAPYFQWMAQLLYLFAKAISFRILATHGTAAYLREQGVEVDDVNKVIEGRPHIVDAMKNGDVQLVINTTEGERSLADSKSIRRTALMMKISYCTTLAGAEATAAAIAAQSEFETDVMSLQDYAKLL